MALGKIAGAIACASIFIYDDPQAAHIEVIAVAQLFRRVGLHLGDQAMAYTLDRIVERAVERGDPEITVSARVHPENSCSRKMLTRAGFREVGRDYYEHWESVVPAPYDGLVY